MRYSHKIHQASHIKSPKIQRRHRFTSLVFLLIVISILLVFSSSNQIAWPSFYEFFAVSLFRISIAYLIASVIAVFLSFLTVKNKYVESILLPILDVSQSFPSFALLPFLIVVFGANGIAVIVILAINIIWPILFTMIGSLKGGRQDLNYAATIFGARGVKRFIHYSIPSVLPSFISGSIIGWGEAWDVVVGAEIIAQVGGIGAFLGNLAEGKNLTTLALAISVYLLLIFVLNQLIWIPLLNYSSRYQSES